MARCQTCVNLKTWWKAMSKDDKREWYKKTNVPMLERLEPFSDVISTCPRTRKPTSKGIIRTTMTWTSGSLMKCTARGNTARVTNQINSRPCGKQKWQIPTGESANTSQASICFTTLQAWRPALAHTTPNSVRRAARRSSQMSSSCRASRSQPPRKAACGQRASSFNRIQLWLHSHLSRTQTSRALAASQSKRPQF